MARASNPKTVDKNWITEDELADLHAAAQTASAGVDDGFWIDVALQLDAAEAAREKKKPKVESR